MSDVIADDAAASPRRAVGDEPPRYRRPAVRPLAPVAPLDTSGGFLFGADVQTPRRDSWRRRSLALADLSALVLAWGLMWLVAPPPGDVLDDLVLLPVLPLWIVLNKVLGLYDRDGSLIHRSTLNELPQIVHSLTLGTALLYLLGPILIPGAELLRGPVVVWWLFAMALTPLLRSAARASVRRSFEPEHVLIIGAGHVASVVAEKIGQHPEYGARLVGYLDVPHADEGPTVGELDRLGDVADFEQVCREHDVERVVIAFSNLEHEALLDLIRMGKRLRLKISVVPRLFEVIGHGVAIDQIEGMTLLGLKSLQLSRSTLMLKRAMDVAGAGIGILLLSPLLIAVSIAVKVDSRGPIFFGQRRIGRRDREFRMWKFRSMVDGAEDLKADLAHLNEMGDGPMFKIAEDPRVTRVGRFLRRTSIDELPQLFNVLRGDMSLVGPRPLIPVEDDHVIGWHRARLDLTPGLTGPWQVLGRNRIPFHEMVKLDYLYVAEWSLWNDVKLILRTLPVMVGRRGA
ncbi:sugar transferase [Conexibacter sp. SYSU D00693]|uniref:sugar transferase n=1 Tax=Conexibacter sp. SYSU D00693 TaxID=2812560 RepID=UPI00196B0AEA|nr:sugar transferase [Conexibacter sp. SYSU D00693]